MAKYIHKGLLTFSLGNKKLSNRTLIFNIPCKYNCNGCYDKKALIYPSARNSRIKNMMGSLRSDFVETFTQVLRENKSKFDYVRFHEGGEFYNQDYLDNITQIVYNNPDIRFFVYTRELFNLNFNGLKSLPNINIVNSIPFGINNYCHDIKWLVRTLKSYGAKRIKLCGDTVNETTKCGVNCHYCMQKGNDIVIFKQH